MVAALFYVYGIFGVVAFLLLCVAAFLLPALVCSGIIFKFFNFFADIYVLYMLKILFY